MTSNE